MSRRAGATVSAGSLDRRQLYLGRTARPRRARSGCGVLFGHGVRKAAAAAAISPKASATSAAFEPVIARLSVFTASSNVDPQLGGPRRPLPGRSSYGGSALSAPGTGRHNRPAACACSQATCSFAAASASARKSLREAWRRAGRACGLASPLPSRRRPDGRPASHGLVGDRGRPRSSSRALVTAVPGRCARSEDGRRGRAGRWGRERPRAPVVVDGRVALAEPFRHASWSCPSSGRGVLTGRRRGRLGDAHRLASPEILGARSGPPATPAPLPLR